MCLSKEHTQHQGPEGCRAVGCSRHRTGWYVEVLGKLVEYRAETLQCYVWMGNSPIWFQVAFSRVTNVWVFSLGSQDS